MSWQVLLCGRDRTRERHGQKQIAPLLLPPADDVSSIALCSRSSALLESGDSPEKKICAPSQDQAKACTFSFSL